LNVTHKKPYKRYEGKTKDLLITFIGYVNDLSFIKSRRIAWLGHVMQMDDKRKPKRILQRKPIGTRTRGRPRKRWIAGNEEDLQIMGVRQWRKKCEDSRMEENH
jgi:hypothetical protein